MASAYSKLPESEKRKIRAYQREYYRTHPRNKAKAARKGLSATDRDAVAKPLVNGDLGIMLGKLREEAEYTRSRLGQLLQAIRSLELMEKMA